MIIASLSFLLHIWLVLTFSTSSGVQCCLSTSHAHVTCLALRCIKTLAISQLPTQYLGLPLHVISTLGHNQGLWQGYEISPRLPGCHDVPMVM